MNRFPAWVEIDLDAAKYNLDAREKHRSPGRRTALRREGGRVRARRGPHLPARRGMRRRYPRRRDSRRRAGAPQGRYQASDTHPEPRSPPGDRGRSREPSRRHRFLVRIRRKGVRDRVPAGGRMHAPRRDRYRHGTRGHRAGERLRDDLPDEIAPRRSRSRASSRISPRPTATRISRRIR